MSEESQGIDPYDVVLKDLYAKREQINQAIAAVEAVRGGVLPGAAQVMPGSSQNVALDGPGAFLGKSIVEAAKMLLSAKRQPLRNPDFAAAFKAGGLVLNSKEPANTIGSVLTRRSNEIGDVVKVGRGTWGLKEWYPNRSFGKKEGASKGEVDAKDGTSEPEQPSGPNLDELLS